MRILRKYGQRGRQHPALGKSLVLLIHVVTLCLTILLTTTSCTEIEVPPTAQTFISQYFKESSVVLVEKDEDDDGEEYSVWFNDGTKVDFDLQGTWKRVSRKKTGVPAVLIPEPIAQYAKTNYPNEAIFKLSRKTYGWKIELSNDVIVKFDPQGAFLEMDD